jgi:streptogramin lyase
MPLSKRARFHAAALALTAALVPAALTHAQRGSGPTNDLPNPYTSIEGAFTLPDGRMWGSTSAVEIGRDGRSIWVAERCGVNSCVADPPTGRMSPLDPILHYDASGKLINKFGAGLLVGPHGIFVDRDGNVWVTDAQASKAKDKGHQVIKFSPTGTVLLTLGKAGVAGSANDEFNSPSDVAVAPNGDIFVADGHDAGSNMRIVKFDKSGKFIKTWGKPGAGPGEFNAPHSLTFDSRGRLFVADRANNRIQIFDQDGKLLDEWKQFSRISGIYIDKNDTLYAVDSESSPQSHPGGWQRGMRIGSAKDGKVTYFIPDPEHKDPKTGAPGGTSAAEGVVSDARGNLYGAEVGPRAVKRYVKK